MLFSLIEETKTSCSPVADGAGGTELERNMKVDHGTRGHITAEREKSGSAGGNPWVLGLADRDLRDR